MHTVLRTIFLFALSASTAAPANAGVERELKRMTGYTIIYGGYIQDQKEKNYGEKYIRLDNGWLFKLDCMIFMPMNMTDVVVFGKSHSDELLKKFPNLPKHLQFQYKLLIDREVCDATLTK